MVDVIINVYGKPWQTLCTLKSLMKYSNSHIDKIFFIEENSQPYNEDVKQILKYFDNIIHFSPIKYLFMPTTKNIGDQTKKENRFISRYQYGIESSDKKYVFITHNDVLYTDDIIGDMLSKIDNSAGIGLIGQCWNCPFFMGNKCDGNRIENLNPTYEEVVNICKQYKPARYTHFLNLTNKKKPMPLPECRLNEFACIINREITMKECFPNGDSRLFGLYDILDLGDAWFRDLVLKGYKFKNYDINKKCVHGYYSPIDSEIRTYEKIIVQEVYTESKFFVSGYPTQLDMFKYKKSEEIAKNYFLKNLTHV